MKVTIVQTALSWEEPQKNRDHFDRLLEPLTAGITDLVVLPEMFTTGFTMQPERLAEPADGPTLQWLQQKAKTLKVAITGSVAVSEHGHFYNRLFWVEANGKVHHYDKRHLFRMAGEDRHYKMGDRKIIAQIRNWKICPLVCYDLRFPVWSRNVFTVQNGFVEPAYDVLVYVANWPQIRSYPWKQLLIARAIENQCYVIGVNRIGADGNGFEHSGDSVVINPRGEIISHTKANEENVETIMLDKSYLEDFRKLFPVGLDADGFMLE